MSEMTMEPQREPWEIRKARAIARTKGVKIALGIPRDKRFFEKLDKSGWSPPASPLVDQIGIKNALESTDLSRFVIIMEFKQDEDEKDAIGRAKGRYMKYRKEPDMSLTGTELRRRIHMRRTL